MPFKRWFPRGLTFSLLLAWGCQGEVPVAVKDDDPGKSKSSSQDSPTLPKSNFVALDFADFTPFLSKPEGDKPTWSVTETGMIQTTGTPRAISTRIKPTETSPSKASFGSPPGKNPPPPPRETNTTPGF